MTTLNLFLVTQTLMRLLDLNVRALLLRGGQSSNLTVTAMPPENAGNSMDTLNMHLYHSMEDAYFKNVPATGTGGSSNARRPLPLSLFYILTAHHHVNQVFDAERQQLLMGLGMKTFHDYAVIDDHLQISPDPVGSPAETVMVQGLQGRDNRIEISLRPMTPEESLSFWSVEQTLTARFSAYYEVRTIFVEHEEPLGVHGKVFDLGLFVSTGQAPVIEKVSSTMQFTPPPQTGLGAQAIDTAPARAILAPGLVPPVNRVIIQGSNLAGDGRPETARIVLRTPAWRQFTPAVRSAVINPALNPAWNVTIGETCARFEIQGQLTIDDGVGGIRNIEVTPGIYAVSVETIRRQETQSGIHRLTTSESNQVAFSIGARIDGFDPPNPAGRMVLRVVNLFDMQAADLDVQLAIDGLLYDEATAFANDATDQGLFVRQAGQLEFHPLFDPAQSGTHPVVLRINGAESQPFWIETP